MSRKARLLTAAAAGCILLTSGCGGGAAPTDARSTPARPSAAPSTASASASAGSLSAAAQSAHPTQDELQAALPPIPSDGRPWISSTGPVGLLTFDQYIGMLPADAQKIARPRETRRGLEFAARRNWEQPDGVVVDVRLVRYAGSTGARSYLLAERAAQQAKSASEFFTVPGIADSNGLASPTLDKVGDASVMVQVLAGDTVILVFEATPATPDRDGATAIAKQVYRSLCTLQDCPAAPGGTV
ncbi:hypothetical protein [Kitasatospora sp. HPMI-4]|uniref:hypothetical protein n=1 Tax=Kitasatospora sp. HPMI-4 TaxID=3448443 RepID=UPI003F1ADFD5